MSEPSLLCAGNFRTVAPTESKTDTARHKAASVFFFLDYRLLVGVHASSVWAARGSVNSSPQACRNENPSSSDSP